MSEAATNAGPGKRQPRPIDGVSFYGEALLDREALMAKFRVRETALRKILKHEDFPPASYEFGDARWLEREVDGWLRDRMDQERAVRRPRR